MRMRMVALTAGVAALVLLVFLPAGTTARSADLVATTGLPVKVLGDASWTAPDGTLVVEGLPTALGVRLDATGLEVRKLTVTDAWKASDTGAPLVGERIASEETNVYGRVRAQSSAGDPELLLAASGARPGLASARSVDFDGASPDVWRDANAQFGALVEDRELGPGATVAPALVGSAATPLPGAITIPAGTYQAETRRGTAVLEEPGEILLLSGALHLLGDTDRTLAATRTLSETAGSVFVPGTPHGTWIGPGAHVEERLEYYVLRASEGSLSLTADSALMRLYADDLRLELNGYVEFPWAVGTVQTSESTERFDAEQVVLGGALRFRAAGIVLDGAPRITLLGNGDVRVLQIGAPSLHLAHAEAAAVAGTAAAGLGLAALAVYFWPSLKYAASLVLFPLYARVSKDEVFEHKAREHLYELVQNEPGISTNKLAKLVPYGWSTLTYHLRVLERSEAIVSVRDGRYKRFFDRRSGRFANGRKFVLAVLKNDATLDIARFIREKPGASQKEVAHSFALAPSSVHWHVQRLSEAGLVEKIREAHNVKYFPGKAWDHVTIEDLQSLQPAPVPGPAASSPGPAAPGPVAS